MPLRNILAIPLALMLGQAAWAHTPQVSSANKPGARAAGVSKYLKNDSKRP